MKARSDVRNYSYTPMGALSGEDVGEHTHHRTAECFGDVALPSSEARVQVSNQQGKGRE